jgi:hypothetical protein
MYPQEQKSSDWCSNMVGINLLSIFPINIALFVYAGFIYGIITALSLLSLFCTTKTNPSAISRNTAQHYIFAQEWKRRQRK